MRISRAVSESVIFTFLLLLASMLFSATQGRPLKVKDGSSSSSSSRFHGNVVGGFEVFFSETSNAGAVKKSGPSRITATLGGINDSGPRPGGGKHRLNNDERLSTTLGGMKDSGPSPGGGHSSVTGSKP